MGSTHNNLFFGVYFLLEKCKKKYNMIEINLVQGLKIKIKLTQKLLNFLMDSVLKKEMISNC